MGRFYRRVRLHGHGSDRILATKKFGAPSSNNAGIYIFGGIYKIDILVDGKCIGQSAPNGFIYIEVEGGKVHRLSIDSGLAPNNLDLSFESGKNYFVRQYVTTGDTVGGAGLEVIPEQQAKADIAILDLAKTGNCSATQK
ncbi:DUF2846 domain-containing protein [Massilia glaciei]|uniref:DUF2846 domain-containing protein n=1 Tax=Massilia glaciei TaxID=1524097 RepID=UPI001E41E905|nr:DUF2846 domain-containing protein [Massilia glaciei]